MNHSNVYPGFAYRNEIQIKGYAFAAQLRFYRLKYLEMIASVLLAIQVLLHLPCFSSWKPPVSFNG